MYWNRFDILEAWYLALSHCHGGMGSEEYERLCRIQSYYTPSMLLDEETLSENGQVIYEAACAKIEAKYT